jgi:hypothetical protein
MQISEVAAAAVADPEFRKTLEDDPVTTMQTLAAMPLQSDVWIYRVVVVALALVAMTAIAGGIGLAVYGKTTPEGVIALGSTALGAIAGLLAPSPNGRGR